jgi:hypothetical protein
VPSPEDPPAHHASILARQREYILPRSLATRKGLAGGQAAAVARVHGRPLRRHRAPVRIRVTLAVRAESIETLMASQRGDDGGPMAHVMLTTPTRVSSFRCFPLVHPPGPPCSVLVNPLDKRPFTTSTLDSMNGSAPVKVTPHEHRSTRNSPGVRRRT